MSEPVREWRCPLQDDTVWSIVRDDLPRLTDLLVAWRDGLN